MCAARTDRSICSQIAGAAALRGGTFLASVQSVLVLGSIALAQVLPCLVQLSLVMLVLHKDFIWNVQKDQGSILPPRLFLGLVLLAPMSKRPLAQAQGLLQGMWRSNTFNFLSAAKTFTSSPSQDRIEGDFPTLRLRRRFVQVANIC